MSPGVAVVTGAASGIGGATVPALTESGFEVIGVDLAPAPDGTTALDWVQGDVVRPDTWTEVVQRCGARDPGGATALVACAADVTVMPLLETPVDEWRRLFDVNVLGVVMAMQALMPAMVERGSGAVAVTCSVNSLFVEEEVSAYSASKSALLSVTRSAALEHARHGLRINAVCPGVVDTPLLRKHLTSLDDPVGAEAGLRRRMPTGAITRPEEVAAALAFLVTEKASGFSGSALVIDGGLTSTYDFVAE
jgi:NAD(P)-dependent dehydrogenase (short-subunit alcohol dehydrogenase family)